MQYLDTTVLTIYDKGTYKLDKDYIEIINSLKLKNTFNIDTEERSPRDESLCSQKIDEKIEEYSTESSKIL